MTKAKSIIIFLIALLFLAACSRPADSFTEAELASAPVRTVSETAAEEPGFVGGVASDTSVGVDQIQELGQERLIIRTGNLSIVVEDTEEALARISQLAESNGGWIVSSNVYQYRDDAKTGDITIRIPAAGFNSALETIKAMALEVTNESTSGQDVTDDYVDLSSRLDNLEATAARVRNFLDETKNVEEALAVNAELSRLEGEIEVIKGRMQYLEQSAAFSTLTVNITPDILSQPLEVGGWRPQGVARDALEALLNTLQGLASFLIWVGILLLPLILLIGVPIWLVARFVVRRRRRRRAAAEASE